MGIRPGRPARRVAWGLATLLGVTIPGGGAEADRPAGPPWARLKKGDAVVVRTVVGKTWAGVVERREADRTILQVGARSRHILDAVTEWAVLAAVHRTYEKEAAAARKKGTAAALFAVADFATRAAMADEARTFLEEVIAVEPGHERARKALGHRQVDGAWLSDEAWHLREGHVRFDGRWIPEAELADAERRKAEADAARVVHLDWEWTVEDEVTPEDHAPLRAVIEEWADDLWQAGEGNFCLRSVTVTGKSLRKGQMHTPAGRKAAEMLDDETWAMVQDGVMLLPGRCDGYTWCHELGHRLFHTPEEYDSEHGCPCVESRGATGGRMQWCDERTHSEEQAEQHPPCWEGYILKAYPDARHPGPGGARPAVKITFGGQ